MQKGAFCIQCEPGNFQPLAGQDQCSYCTDVPPSYSLAGMTQCEECHEGARCARGVFSGAMPGWWAYRPLDTTSATEGGVETAVDGVELFQECKPINGFNASRCLGGRLSTCAEGHWGPLCSLCQPYHYKGADKCMPCDEGLFNSSTGSAAEEECESTPGPPSWASSLVDSSP